MVAGEVVGSVMAHGKWHTSMSTLDDNRNDIPPGGLLFPLHANFHYHSSTSLRPYVNENTDDIRAVVTIINIVHPTDSVWTL